MKINNKLFKGVLTFVAFLVLIGSGLSFYLRLEEPVFFQHYYEVSFYKDSRYNQNIFFNLGYITNANDDRIVSGIEFLTYPDLKIQVSSESNSYPFNGGNGPDGTLGEIHGEYSVRGVSCHVIDDNDFGELVLKKAKVRFSDSSEIIVDVGEIYFLERAFLDIPLEHVSSSSSSDGTGTTIYKALKEIKVKSFNSPLMEKFKDRVQIKINGTEHEAALGMSIEEGKYLSVTSKVGPAKDMVSKYTLFDLQPNLSMTTLEGLQYNMSFYNMDSLLHPYNFFDLYRYIKAREGK